MNLALVIYLAETLGKLGLITAFVGVAVLLATMLEVIITHLDRKPQDRRTKILAITCVALLAVSVFIPSQKTVYAMLAASTAQEVAQTPEAKALLDKALKLLNIKLDEAVKK